MVELFTLRCASEGEMCISSRVMTAVIIDGGGGEDAGVLGSVFVVNNQCELSA